MSFRSKFALVVFSASIALYAVIGGMYSRAQQLNDPGPQLRIFESVLQHIRDDYVDDPDLAKVRAGALRGLAYGLDPYSTYLTPDQVHNYTSGPDKDQVGIGAELSQVASYLYVIAPVKGGPADRAGIQSGDVIEYIDNKATRDISLYDARQLLNGAPNTELKLRILRSNSRPFMVTVRRAATKAPAAEAKMEEGRIGFVRVNSLADGEANDVRARIQELQKQGAQKLVLDLRSVAGGSLNEGARVSNFFIRDGVLAETIGRGEKVQKSFQANPTETIFNGPLVALIDRGTAGAAEVVASALIEHKRADVVGEKSFGAGTEQQLFTLKNGDGLLLTVAKWASSGGKAFLGTGVDPSVVVKRPELAESIEPEDLTGNDDDSVVKPAASSDKREVSAEASSIKQVTEDIQLRKALDLLRQKGVAQQRPS